MTEDDIDHRVVVPNDLFEYLFSDAPDTFAEWLVNYKGRELREGNEDESD